MKALKRFVRIGLRQQAQRSLFCHCEERSDMAIRLLIAGLLGDGLPHQSADWFAMTGKLNQADSHKTFYHPNAGCSDS